MKIRAHESAVDRFRGSRIAGLATFCMTIAVIATPAVAERTDRNQPVNLEADRVTVDDANHVTTFEGSVVLSQGTLTIRGDRMVVKQDAEGFQYGTAYGAPASFRQKREKRDEYIEGYGGRIEYDNKTNRLQLLDHAQLKKGGDDVRGDHISYDQKTEFYRVVGNSEQVTKSGPRGRVRAVIQPKSGGNKVEKAPPLPLKPATQITPSDDPSSSAQ